VSNLLCEKNLLIRLDCMIPKLSGFELYKIFQSLSQTSFIPILMISGGPEDPRQTTKSTA
jgi:PleD family two-component response regulator